MGLEFKVYGLEFRVLGFRVFGFMDQGLHFGFREYIPTTIRRDSGTPSPLALGPNTLEIPSVKGC